MKWFTKAADKQYAQAMNDIGELYNRALGVKKDQDKAREWMSKAAAAGDTDAKQWLSDHPSK